MENVIDNPVSDYYAGREVFVTGGSGLMGKALLEKCLRSCPHLSKIYVLLREHRGKSSKERLEDLKKTAVFNRLREENASALDKLVPIGGDISLIGLGMSEESLKLMANVSIIFHVAASIRFVEPLPSAIFLNIRGTREVLNFATKLNNLTMFVHVSTAYSNIKFDYIEEKVYPPIADWQNMIKIAEKYDEMTLAALAHKILGIFPNTYTFTKHLAEQTVNDYADKIPVCIVRPSIVISSASEPYAGWFDRFLAIIGLITAVYTGAVRTLYCRPTTVLDMIPLDFGVKLFISAPWWKEVYEKETKVLVLNMSIAALRPLSIATLAKLSDESIEVNAFKKTLWTPEFCLTDSSFYFYYRIYLFHLLPALFIDGLLWIRGKKPLMIEMQRNQLATQQAFAFFNFNSYKLEQHRLYDMLKVFRENPEFEIHSNFKETSHMIARNTLLGSRRYLLKENDASLPKSIMKFKILKIVDFIICKGFKLYMSYLLFCWISLRISA